MMAGNTHRVQGDTTEMPLNLSVLAGTGNNEPLIRPREIYAALPNRPWPYLRHEQGEVLERWFEPRRDDRDVVIKQNTGGGKTVIGLLIARSSLNEGVGPAVYLTADTYLAKQVRAEAARLGIATTDDPGDLGFRSGDTLLVTTFHKLVNGLSVFGVVGDSRPQHIDVGLVIVDDAHAALASAEGQFRLTVPAGHAAYEPLMQIFEADCRDQSPKAWADVKANEYTAAVRVPFWAWHDKQDQVMAVLHPHRGHDDLKFAWPLIADVLPLCAATITCRGIEVKPPCLPIAMIPAFAKARRRVYLTATLADDSVLVTDLDADPELVRRPVTPGSAADLGDRMILAPQGVNRALDDDAIRVMAQQFAAGDRDGDGVAEADPVNVVVLVPSDAAAAKWKPYRDREYHVKDLEAGVAELKAGHVGVVVLVNKYDGVDLLGDACRLLILDGMPRPMDATERREASVLSGSHALFVRQIQRVEQGMGRGVRDSEDHCVVLLLGPELAFATHDQGQQELFSPATRAQLALSRQVADQIQGEGLTALKDAIGACLDRAPEWVTASRRALADIHYAQTSTVRGEAVAARKAFDLAATGRMREAADHLQRPTTEVSDAAVRGLLLEQRAAYLHPVDAGAAQRMLSTALEYNRFVLRPAAGVTPAPARATAAQSAAASAFLLDTYKDAMGLVLGVKVLLSELVWGDEERSDDAEAAWKQLGLHLGLVSTRPDKEYGRGPDNLWVLSDSKHAAIELKTGCTTATISKSDVDQLGGSVRWDMETHPGVQALPVMVHQSSTVDQHGTVIPGMRVVTRGKWEELQKAVTAFTVALANGQGRWADEQAVAEQLVQHRLMAGNFFQTFSEAARAEQ